jgi:hypothetical protein
MAEQLDVTLVRQWWDACMKGDLDTAGTMMTADAVHHIPGQGPLSGHYKGRDAIFDMYRRFSEAGENMQIDLKSLLSDGHGHVMSVHQSHYERKGRAFEPQEGIVFTVTGGKISDIDEFTEDVPASDAFWS